MIYGLRVFAIGGGTGLSAMLGGLKRFVQPPEAGSETSLYFADLCGLVTVADDGGSSGRLREELEMLAPGDIRNCLVALSADESLLSSLFQHRFGGSGNLSGHNFGNLFLAALTSVTGDFHEAVRAASRVLNIEGRIFPSTSDSISLVAELEDGSKIKGETRISQSQRRIRRISLNPPDCKAPDEALRAIEQADLVLIGPGSLYTSLIPNLLVPGVVETLRGSSALIVYMSNAMTQPGETAGYSIEDHVEAILQHCPELSLSYVLANNKPLPRNVVARYRKEGSVPVLPNGNEKLPCPLVLEDLLQPRPVVRHDGVKAGRALLELFQRARVRSPVS